MKRKKSKVTGTSVLSIKIGRQYIPCSECGMDELEVPTDVSKVICSRCVQKMSAPPEKAPEKSDKPKGWHLKIYFEHNGNVYSRGKLITDSAEIKKLKVQRLEETKC